MTNTTLWDSVVKTDPKYTKGFSKGGGFKGTATNATYLAKKATEQFGPCGTGWGLKVLTEDLLQGAPVVYHEGLPVAYEMIHRVHVQFWYVLDGKRGEIEHFGQTVFVGKNKNGLFTDEEAPKKSMTDAMSKCLSLLGFSADIHLGLYDDSKYVSGLEEQFNKITSGQREMILAKLEQTNSDLAKFLTAMKIEVIDDLPADSFERVVKLLAHKARTMRASPEESEP